MRLDTAELPLAALVIGALILGAYGGLFGAWFHPIDDALHLAGVMEGEYPIAHPRPAHFAWNRALFALFGTHATAWHAAGLALHFASALLLFRLARHAGATRLAALGGACVFAVLHAPLAAVAWISAVSGPLVVCFVLLSGICWWRHLDSSSARARWTWYLAALLALFGAAASKEDCVLAGPLLIGLHVMHGGWREFLRPRSLLRYAPFALVGAVYLAIAFDPTIWSSRPGVGEYRFSLRLFPRALTNLAALAWPRHILAGVAPSWMLPAGASIFAALVGVARPGRARWQRLLLFGLTMTLFGLLPVLPGPWEAVAASRLGYPSALGVGFIAAGLVDGTVAHLPRVGRGAAAVALVIFCAVHAWSVRSTISWRFVAASHDYRHLIESTLETLDASATGSVLYLAPPVWNELDHERGAIVFASGRSIETERVSIPLTELDEQLNAWSEQAAIVVWSEGRWHPRSAGALDRDALSRAAEANATHGFTGRVPATWLRRGPVVE